MNVVKRLVVAGFPAGHKAIAKRVRKMNIVFLLSAQIITNWPVKNVQTSPNTQILILAKSSHTVLIITNTLWAQVEL